MKSLKQKEANKKCNLIWNKKYPKKIKAYKKISIKNGKNKAALIKHRYGLTPDQFKKLLKKQKDKCLICKNIFTVKSSPVVDHNRKCCPSKKSCGKCIRGLLCFKCNVGLGFFKDNIKILKSAILYLKKK